MLRGLDFYKKFGDPYKHNGLVMWDVPTELEIGVIPKKIWCNAIMIAPLTEVFKNLIKTGLVDELKTWDGCVNIRPVRGHEKIFKDLMDAGKVEAAMLHLSIHSWGGAVDVNAFENGLNRDPKLSPEFVKIWMDAGFDWGGDKRFGRKDGMHFQLAKI